MVLQKVSVIFFQLFTGKKEDKIYMSEDNAVDYILFIPVPY